MKITRQQLQQAAEQHVIEPGQVEPLFDFLSSRNKDQPSFDFTHVLYYLSGLVAIGAMSLFMTLGWERFGGFAFWLYLFGVLTFWGGLSGQHSDSEMAKFLYFSINLAMIGIGAILLRRVFVVFGAIGAAGYLGHLASTVFRDSWLFPISLTLIGLGIIYLGILWQRNEQAIGARMRSRLPMELRHLLAERG